MCKVEHCVPPAPLPNSAFSTAASFYILIYSTIHLFVTFHIRPISQSWWLYHQNVFPVCRHIHLLFLHHKPAMCFCCMWVLHNLACTYLKVSPLASVPPSLWSFSILKPIRVICLPDFALLFSLPGMFFPTL